MNAYLHCLSHTPLVGYVDPEQAVLDEVNGTIADARARIAAFDPELVVLFAQSLQRLFLRCDAAVLFRHRRNFYRRFQQRQRRSAGADGAGEGPAPTL